MTKTTDLSSSIGILSADETLEKHYIILETRIMSKDVQVLNIVMEIVFSCIVDHTLTVIQSNYLMKMWL